MMMNNPGVMGPSVSHPPPPAQGQPQGPPTGAPMMPVPPGAPVNPSLPLQTRQAQNEEILNKCLLQTQRLREHLEVLLNTTKQAALMDSEDLGSGTLSSSGQGNTASGANQGLNPTANSIKSIIDQRLLEMNNSLEVLGTSLDQYDFKLFLNQQSFANYFNELSHEKQGGLIEEWSSNIRWANRFNDITPVIHPSVNIYRRSNARQISAVLRSRADGFSAATVDRLIAQCDQSSALNTGPSQPTAQGVPTKECALSSQRLSDNLVIVQMSLLRSGLDVYLYLRQFTVEHVIVKPLNEKKQFGIQPANKIISNYHALKLIAGHIRAAAVYMASISAQPDQALQKLLIYISKYNQLHSQKCFGCQKHLLNGLQPTWRDFKSYEPYHEECLA